MKNTAQMAISAIALLILFSGCDDLKEIKLDKTVNMEFTVDLGADDPAVLNLSEAFEFATGDLEEYRDYIKRYEVKSLRYKVWEFYTETPGEDATLDGILGIASVSGADPGVEFTMTGLSLLASNDNPSHTEIELPAADLEKVEQYLLNSNGLKLFLNGSVSSVPVHFKLQVVADVTAIAEKE
jgi:hypothetical protein